MLIDDFIDIGGWENTSERFTGKMDEVRVWNRALSSQELQDNASRELPANTPGLVHYLRFNEEDLFTVGSSKRVLNTMQAVSLSEDTAETVQLFATGGEGALTFSIAQQPQHGTFELDGTSFTYTPAPNFSGRDYFTYTATDSLTTSLPATVALDVRAVNDPPTTTNQNLEVEAGELVAIPITAQDVDSEEITLALKGSPGHGTASLDSGTVYYQSDAGYVGMDMVQYTATDEDGASATGTITLTVGVSNMPPVAQPQSISVLEDSFVSTLLTGTDVNGDTLSFELTRLPQYGSATLVGDSLTYTPAPDYNGIDSVLFKASDGLYSSASAAVSIVVEPVNDAPVVFDTTATTNEDQAVAIILAAGDPDGDELTYAIASGPSNGSATLSGNTVTYTPNENYSGSDSFTFTVSDETITSAPATVSISAIQSQTNCLLCNLDG